MGKGSCNVRQGNQVCQTFTCRLSASRLPLFLLCATVRESEKLPGPWTGWAPVRMCGWEGPADAEEAGGREKTMLTPPGWGGWWFLLPSGQQVLLFGNSRLKSTAQDRSWLQPSLLALLVSVHRAFFLLALPDPVLHSISLSVPTMPLQPIPYVKCSPFELPKMVSVFLAGVWLIQKAPLSEDLQEAGGQAVWVTEGRVLQAEGRGSTKALWGGRAGQVRARVRGPAWPDGVDLRRERWRWGQERWQGQVLRSL